MMTYGACTLSNSVAPVSASQQYLRFWLLPTVLVPASLAYASTEEQEPPTHVATIDIKEHLY